MRALLLQYTQTRPRESRARFPRPVRRLCQTPVKRKNVSARVINRDRSDRGSRERTKVPRAVFLRAILSPDERARTDTIEVRFRKRRRQNINNFV